jgi:hypothetical protein
VNVDAILCNHAEAVNNLLYVSGGGIDAGFVQPGANPPYVINVGIGIMVTVPWEQTNQQHEVEIELVDEDGHPALLATGPDSSSPLHVKLAFNIGRPATGSLGDDQHICLAANLPGLPLPALGKYGFIVRVDGFDERKLGYRLTLPPGTQIVANPPGPGAIGHMPS